MTKYVERQVPESIFCDACGGELDAGEIYFKILVPPSILCTNCHRRKQEREEPAKQYHGTPVAPKKSSVHIGWVFENKTPNTVWFAVNLEKK